MVATRRTGRAEWTTSELGKHLGGLRQGSCSKLPSRGPVAQAEHRQRVRGECKGSNRRRRRWCMRSGGGRESAMPKELVERASGHPDLWSAFMITPCQKHSYEEERREENQGHADDVIPNIGLEWHDKHYSVGEDANRKANRIMMVLPILQANQQHIGSKPLPPDLQRAAAFRGSEPWR